jgi:polyhydroxyalkanoate synthesis regulator phasin
MSSKTEILSFDNAISEHKRALTESLVGFDEGQRVRKIMLDIDSNSADYEYYFQSGQQSKKGEVDKLQTEVDDLHKRVKELELINFDSELHFDAAKEHIDRLQKLVDEIRNHVEINYDENRDDDSHVYWSGYNQALRELFEILK